MNAAGPTGGTLLRPSDGKHPQDDRFCPVRGLALRRLREKGKDYCSKICCMYTAKHAMLCREKYPDTDVYVFYIDVRTPGKNFDEFYRRAVEEYGVHYIKGMVGKVVARGRTSSRCRPRTCLTTEQLHIDADMVVLAAAIEPDKSARLARDDADGLAWTRTTSLPKRTRSSARSKARRQACSCPARVRGRRISPRRSRRPSAAAAKVIGLLCKDSLTCNPCVAQSGRD